VKVEAELPVKNTDRAVGTKLARLFHENHGAAGLPDDTIQLRFKGSAGQSFALSQKELV
jgi:glutamate synthase domain-containing protein 3